VSTAAPAPGEPPGDEAERWREAARLCREHVGWIVIWLGPACEFHAYRRLPGARRDTALTAATAAGLGVLIGLAEDNARPRSHEDRI
jgi:hypothetical protein